MSETTEGSRRPPSGGVTSTSVGVELLVELRGDGGDDRDRAVAVADVVLDDEGRAGLLDLRKSDPLRAEDRAPVRTCRSLRAWTPLGAAC